MSIVIKTKSRKLVSLNSFCHYSISKIKLFAVNYNSSSHRMKDNGSFLNYGLERPRDPTPGEAVDNGWMDGFGTLVIAFLTI